MRQKITFLVMACFIMLFTKTNLHADTPGPRSVKEVIDESGKLIPGIKGSFNAEGYKMQTGPDGEPHFVSGGDGSWSTLGSGTNGRVNALLVSGSFLYVGGDFSTAGGVPANNIARWNGSVWSALGSGVNNEVKALAVNDNYLYVGGLFTTAGGNSANHIAYYFIPGGSWNNIGSGTSGNVYAININEFSNQVFVGGTFNSAGGVTVYSIAKFTLFSSNWSAVGTGANIGLNGSVYAIASLERYVYIGGFFTNAGGITVSNFVRYDVNANSWNSMSGGMNAAVRAITIDGNNFYVGGDFTTAGGTAANKIAWFIQGSGFVPLGSGIEGSGVVEAIVRRNNNNIYVGGSFNTAGGVSANNIAHCIGTSWSSLGSGVSSDVYSLLSVGSEIYVGGNFFTPWNYIAYWNTVGPEPQLSLNHTPSNFTMGIFNNGSIGKESQDPFAGPGITWMGENGCFTGGVIYGTTGRGSCNGNIGSSFITDMANVESSFESGFLFDNNFNQITYALMDDSNAPSPYGLDVYQRSNTNTNSDYGFIRYSFKNTTGSTITGLRAGIFMDWDIGNFANNSGGYAPDRRMVYNYEPGGKYFGIVAVGGFSGMSTTTSGSADPRIDAFTNISNNNFNSIGANGDFRTWIGSNIGNIGSGETNTVTFAIVSGPSLSYIRSSAAAAQNKALSLGWISTVGIDPVSSSVPDKFSLSQNYPNPFNPSTMIRFDIQNSDLVILNVYNSLGQKVSQLINENLSAGTYETQFDGSGLNSGIYFYTLQTGDFVETKKMILIK